MLICNLNISRFLLQNIFLYETLIYNEGLAYQSTAVRNFQLDKAVGITCGCGECYIGYNLLIFTIKLIKYLHLTCVHCS